MRGVKGIWVTGLLTFVLLFAFPGSGTAQDGEVELPEEPVAGSGGRDFEAGTLIVKLEEGATKADLRALNRRNDARIERDLPVEDVSVVDLPSDLSVREAVEVYESSPDVEYAEPDYYVFPAQATPDDSYYPEMWGLNNTGQTGGTPDADIDAPEAWSVATGDPGTLVAIIDTGADVNHPDLRDNVWTNPGEIPDNGVDDDGNGYVDDVNGWDFVNKDNSVYDPSLLTGAGEEHGTHVAGTVAASGDNAQGVTGVNWRADLMILKFIGSDGLGLSSDAAAAIDYAARNGATISNNSWGGPGKSRTIEEAIRKAGGTGHLFVAAAGNVADDNDASPSYPASFDDASIIAVAATDHNDALASFSNYGASSVDLAAPGSRILSTLPNRSYGRKSGTSMATPHVAGVAALLKSENPSLQGAQLKAKIMQSVEAKPALAGKTVTGGRLNAARALDVTLQTDLTLAAQPSVLTFGQATKLSGELRTDGGGLGGRTVVLEGRRVGTENFQRLAETTTAASGGFAFEGVKPQAHTEYRARFEGSQAEGLTSTTSATRRVDVRVAVALNVASTDLKLGRTRAVSGTVRPLHGGSVTVTIKRNGEVISRRSVALDSLSRYRFDYKPGRVGKYSFVAAYPKDADHLGGRSAPRSFTVVR